MGLIVPSSLCFSGLPVEAGFLAGVALCRVGLAMACKGLSAGAVFSSALGGRHLPSRGSDEVRMTLLADVPFPRLSAARFFLGSLAVSVLLWRWRSIFPRRGALCYPFPPIGLPIVSRQLSRSLVYQEAERSRGIIYSRSVIPFVSFEAADLSGIKSEGHRAFPICKALDPAHLPVLRGPRASRSPSQEAYITLAQKHIASTFFKNR